MITDINFITLKPVLYIANISNNDHGFADKLLDYVHQENSICILVNIIQELKYLRLNLKDTHNLCFRDYQKSKINEIILTGYQLLNLQTFFTVGKKEVRAWTINIGDTSIQAARKIHTDFQKGFIRAQVISYDDFIKFQDESKLRKLGKIRLEGKNYLVKDGDIINFLFKI